MLKLDIHIEGNTDRDIEFTLSEVKSKVEQGFTSFADKNEDGSFYFDIKGEEDA